MAYEKGNFHRFFTYNILIFQLQIASFFSSETNDFTFTKIYFTVTSHLNIFLKVYCSKWIL